MKKLILFLFSIVVVSVSFAQSEAGRIDSIFIPKPILHPQEEYTFDQPVDAAAWNILKQPWVVQYGNTDQAYFRTELPELNRFFKEEVITGWKGERLNTLVTVIAKDSIEQVRFLMGDLKGSNGQVINKKNIHLNLVRYVLSNYPYDAGDASCGDGPVDKAYLLPDRLESLNEGQPFDVPGKTVRPVWISIEVPSAIVAGKYSGQLTIVSSKGKQSLDLTVVVQNKVLPAPSAWKFRLDLWQNPFVSAHYFNLRPWSPEHKEILKQHLKHYADAGGKYITTYVVHSPWADITYYPDEGMVEWIKQKDGKWAFDYSIFDQYVELAMSVGINKAITVYTPIPWGERFRYLDKATEQYIYERWLPTSDTFKRNWNIFLTDLRAHLEKKGWFNKTYLGVNENAMEQTLSAIDVIRQHSKDWKITYAGDWHKELDPLLDDYSCVYGKEPEVKDLQRRNKKGQSSTFYICCTPPKPNTFVFSPPVEGRWLGWYTKAHGYDGMLRWAYDSWTSDVNRDARHVFWGAGDAFMTYPSGSSIRFEKMREGIVDFEKMNILAKDAVRSKDDKVARLYHEFQQLLSRINNEKDFKKESLEGDISKGQTLLNELTTALYSSKPL